MGLNDTPRGERIHIAVFGKRNAGKSSVINALTGQKLSVVSEIAGTTTDPVSKAMELLPLGPVMMTDTPGLDDAGELGGKRIDRALEVLRSTDIALLVVDACVGITDEDEKILGLIKEQGIPYIRVFNKIDKLEGAVLKGFHNVTRICDASENAGGSDTDTCDVYVSAATDENISLLAQRIARLGESVPESTPIISDLVEPGDIVVLVVPIDKAAPKGRLILPQQQTIRELLEAGAMSLVVRETELESALDRIGHLVKMVVTDSQVFGFVNKIVPPSIALTSFSILMARHKGNLKPAMEGARVLDTLQNGERVLISEGCTHHRQCGDIGTQKLPAWIRKHCNAEPEFVFTSGREFPTREELSGVRLVIHCGGCMLNEREMQSRYQAAVESGIPITNYGIAISHMNGILGRCTQMLGV